jgi:preprotein translocase subunit SecA
LSFQHAQAPGLAQAAPPAAPPGARMPPPQAPGRQPGGSEAPAEPFVREQPKVGRNQPCPCGSGTKYKPCHGRLA